MRGSSLRCNRRPEPPTQPSPHTPSVRSIIVSGIHGWPTLATDASLSSSTTPTALLCLSATAPSTLHPPAGPSPALCLK